VPPLLAGVLAEGGGGSGKALVFDLYSSSDEEDLIAATSRDFEFTQRLFGELNHTILGLPSDGKVIILNDSDEEKEAHEEKTTDTEPAGTSATVNPASTASADTDDAPTGAKNDNSDDQGPDQEAGGDNDSEGGTDEP
jgi:hypothetical protein